MPASTKFTLLVAGIHDVTGGPVVQWEDEIPDIQVARLPPELSLVDITGSQLGGNIL